MLKKDCAGAAIIIALVVFLYGGPNNSELRDIRFKELSRFSISLQRAHLHCSALMMSEFNETVCGSALCCELIADSYTHINVCVSQRISEVLPRVIFIPCIQITDREAEKKVYKGTPSKPCPKGMPSDVRT